MTIWRIAIIAIIFFWLGMNALLIRRTYFPDNGGQQEVRPSLVLQRFAQHTDYINNLNLMRGKEKFGHATISAKLWLEDTTNTPRGYEINAGGMILGKLWEQPQLHTSWSLTGRIDEAQVWHKLDLRIRTPESSVVLMWEKDKPEPKIEVMRGGKVVMDTAAVMAQAKFMAGMPGLGSIAGMGFDFKSKDLSAETAVTVKATEGLVDLAGQNRRGFQLQFELMKILKATAFFTEAGELARVDLPNQMQLLDPIIFGLAAEDTADLAPSP